MTRFKKEMIKQYPDSFDEFRQDYESNGAYTIEEKALIVFYNPGIIEVYRVNRDNTLTDVSIDYPEITSPYLMYLYHGDVEKVKEVLKGAGGF